MCVGLFVGHVISTFKKALKYKMDNLVVFYVGILVHVFYASGKAYKICIFFWKKLILFFKYICIRLSFQHLFGNLLQFHPVQDDVIFYS